MDQKKSAILKNLEEKSQEINRITKKITEFKKVLEKIPDRPLVPRRPPPAARVPVQKNVQQGKRGGLYYLNASDKKNYLTPAQCRKCMAGNFGHSGCPPPRLKKCPLTKAQLKAKNKKLKKQIKRLRSEKTAAEAHTQKVERQRRERDARRNLH